LGYGLKNFGVCPDSIVCPNSFTEKFFPDIPQKIFPDIPTNILQNFPVIAKKIHVIFAKIQKFFYDISKFFRNLYVLPEFRSDFCPTVKFFGGARAPPCPPGPYAYEGSHIMLKSSILTLPIMLKVFPYYADNYATSYSITIQDHEKNNNFIQFNINLGTVT
jgi:hypothetical protein